ncbi:uncharacterized protein LOC126965612 isoform X2 [Leptidea sinapis]|nr:uncharacterized protein LOC126965612 isoform X2 [Leptidea sinapis]
MAALTAVHLVSQVLEEANVIANAAYDSGQPWKYVLGLQKMAGCLDATYVTDSILLVPNGDKENFNESKINSIMTSTPQKLDNIIHGNTEYMLIGQGDEVFNDDSDTTKSTSLFINNLFDLSDVELTAYCDESETQDIIETDILVTMKSVMESFINSALNRAFGEETVAQSKTPSDVSSQSSYSYMDDATFPTLKDDILNNYGEGSNMVVPVENHDANIDKVDLASYENAFLTLNREEQCSENQEEPITLAEPNPSTLQEVSLVEDGSGDLIQAHEEKIKEFTAVSKSSTMASKRSTLARRCRSQGARLLACLRGWWWKRKVLGKRKESRHGSICGKCPISPEARWRAASLLDNHRSPSLQNYIWKFNTVNEALVHSSRWKDISSEIN